MTGARKLIGEERTVEDIAIHTLGNIPKPGPVIPNADMSECGNPSVLVEGDGGTRFGGCCGVG